MVNARLTGQALRFILWMRDFLELQGQNFKGLVIIWYCAIDHGLTIYDEGRAEASSVT